MPKLKTNKAASKRFKMTASGKIKRPKANKRHNLSTKTKDQKRRLRAGGLVHERDEAPVKLLLPYGR
ncbi:MAG: 50S ribosomal protein L35 [Leptospirales bacterium]|nr:50S ribosomal protein L35 [Leptospirales bacterium]